MHCSQIFLLRWNQNIDVRIRGLDQKYDGLYDGTLFENEIEQMLLWPAREAPAHPDSGSSKNVQYTGENFGSIECQAQEVTGADASGSDASLNDLADVAADEIEELDEDVDEREAFLNKLLASTQWAARLRGKFRSRVVDFI